MDNSDTTEMVPEQEKNTADNKKERMLVAGTAGLIIFVILTLTAVTIQLPSWFHFPSRVTHSVSKQTAAVPSQKKEEINRNAFSDVSISGRAAYVIDLSTNKILFEKNATVQLPLASLTKIMTVLVSSDVLSPETDITISEEMLTPEGDTGLRVGDSWSLHELMALTLIASSNDGAEALASVASSEKSRDITSLMNEKAKAIGLTETFFANPTGLDVSGTQGGSYGSARDMAKLFAYAIQYNLPIVEYSRHASYVGKSEQGGTVLVSNTNDLINSIPGLLASKTGFTDLAGGNLVVVFDRGLAQPVIIAVLGSTQEGRFSDVAELVRATTAYYHVEL